MTLDEYREQGYALFRGALTHAEIDALREAGAAYFRDGRTHMSTRAFLGIPAFAALPFHARIAERTAELFGKDYVTLSQFSVSANLHNPQWHRDSQSQLGDPILYDPDYLVAKCAVYLQDNDPEWGGGMEIVERSHLPAYLPPRSSLSRGNPIGKVTRFVQRKIVEARNKALKRLWLPLKAGDALVFHANLVHRASQPAADKPRGGHRNAELRDAPPEKFKYLVDWEVSPDNRHVAAYLRHQKQRAQNEPGLFRDSLDVRYPQDYPPDVVARIRALGLKVVHYADAERRAEAA
jgi:ectoine hydroxylase-related dioxygenase (phytanoyl-CoA dioxygenase family)